MVPRWILYHAFIEVLPFYYSDCYTKNNWTTFKIILIDDLFSKDFFSQKIYEVDFFENYSTKVREIGWSALFLFIIAVLCCQK